MKAVIYLAGALVWIYIFYHLDFTRLDWPSNVYYLNCWRENLREWNVPPTCEPKLGFVNQNMLTWAYPFYLAALLSWLPDRVCFCVMWLINYTIGFWGAVKLWEFPRHDSCVPAEMRLRTGYTHRAGRAEGVVSLSTSCGSVASMFEAALIRPRSITGELGFGLFWFLFNFNGFQVLKLEAGHVQNAGYLLTPWLLYFVSRSYRVASSSSGNGA